MSSKWLEERREELVTQKRLVLRGLVRLTIFVIVCLLVWIVKGV